jgi:cyclopropane fatty-acyl-phospholipid synthase-like methyltransferase
MYQSTPPWDIGRPQKEFLRLAENSAIRGSVLDVGCGTGEHTLMVAARGLEALGIDTTAVAIASAERKARERGIAARFLVHDALHLPELGEQFDTALDCGLFHVFNDEDRRAFVDSLSAVVRPGGRSCSVSASANRVISAHAASHKPKFAPASLEDGGSIPSSRPRSKTTAEWMSLHGWPV